MLTNLTATVSLLKHPLLKSSAPEAASVVASFTAGGAVAKTTRVPDIYTI